jgi:hypothetical protein
MAGGRFAWMFLVLAAAATPAVGAQDIAARDPAYRDVGTPPLTSLVLWSVSTTGERTRLYRPDRDIPVADWRSAAALLPNKDHAATIWSIFAHPPDSPDDYVVRETLTGPDWIVVSPASLHAATLDAARAMLPPGVVEMVKSPSDADSLVEIWIGP